MRPCGLCGDMVPDTASGHADACWVRQKLKTQELLSQVIASDYAVMRPAQTDAEWFAAHPDNL